MIFVAVAFFECAVFVSTIENTLTPLRRLLLPYQQMATGRGTTTHAARNAAAAAALANPALVALLPPAGKAMVAEHLAATRHHPGKALSAAFNSTLGLAASAARDPSEGANAALQLTPGAPVSLPLHLPFAPSAGTPTLAPAQLPSQPAQQNSHRPRSRSNATAAA